MMTDPAFIGIVLILLAFSALAAWRVPAGAGRQRLCWFIDTLGVLLCILYAQRLPGFSRFGLAVAAGCLALYVAGHIRSRLAARSNGVAGNAVAYPGSETELDAEELGLKLRPVR